MHGREQYSDVRVGGKPVSPDRVVTHPPLSTRGEFGSDLVYLFTPPRAAEFKLQKRTTLQAHAVIVYEFHLPADKNTFWTLYDANNRSLRPELRGELWIEPQQAKLLRLQLEPIHLPLDFAIESGMTTIDFADVSLSDAGVFLMPVSSKTEACSREYNLNLLGPCLYNVVSFHDCHKFTAKTKVSVIH